MDLEQEAMKRTWVIVAGGVALALASAGASPPGAGWAVSNFEPADSLGKNHALNDHAQSKAVVVAFLGVDCPLANRYAARLGVIAKEYRPRGLRQHLAEVDRGG
jgi:hypothetical protein